MRVTKAEDIKNALKSAKQNTKMPTVIEFIIDRETNVMPIVPPGNSLNDMILERKTGMMNSSPCWNQDYGYAEDIAQETFEMFFVGLMNIDTMGKP